MDMKIDRACIIAGYLKSVPVCFLSSKDLISAGGEAQTEASHHVCGMVPYPV